MSQIQLINTILSIRAKNDAIADFLSDSFWDTFPSLN